MAQKMLQWLKVSSVLVVILFGHNIYYDSAFEEWKERFKHRAQMQGISEALLDTAFHRVHVHDKVLRLDSYQPEFSRSIWQYLTSAVSQGRIEKGQKLLVEHQALLDQIAQKYEVPKQYLLAIWAVETDYGYGKGRYSVIRSLATLAYAGREERRKFWEQQLLAALEIVQAGDIPLAQLRGSWAGAIGHTQFMPMTFLEYAVDFDGDGKRDLIHSIADALASSANYLSQSGWIAHENWAQEVALPEDFEWRLSDPNIWQPVDDWSLYEGVRSLEGQELSGVEEAFLFLPAGHKGPAFLAFGNFKMFLEYNNAYSYALSVGHLGDRISGGSAFQGEWPKDEKVLSREQTAEMQEMLTVAGYSTDGIDGRIGPNTRAALRRWQYDNEYPADGFATLAILEQLRKQVELGADGSLPIYKRL